MSRQQDVLDNKQAILNKLGMLDIMIESSAKVHKDNEEAQEALFKKISTRKLVLMDELYTLLSPLN